MFIGTQWPKFTGSISAAWHTISFVVAVLVVGVLKRPKPADGG
jgi:hypothetical protein